MYWGILISAHLSYTLWLPFLTAAREWEASLWSATFWICWPTHMTKAWTTALGLPFSEAAFCSQQHWPHFRSEERRVYGVNLLTGCLRSQHHMDMSSGEGPAACGAPVLTHTDHGLHLWGLSGKRICRAKLLQKSLCSIPVHLRDVSPPWEDTHHWGGCLLPNPPYVLQWGTASHQT